LVPKKLIEEIERWIGEKKFGHLQINFSEGRIVNVNRVESIRLTMIGTSIGEATITKVEEV